DFQLRGTTAQSGQGRPDSAGGHRYGASQRVLDDRPSIRPVNRRSRATDTVSHRSGNRNVRAVWTGPQSPLGHVCQTSIVVLSLLVLVFAPLAFGAVRLWALGPVFMAIEVAAVLWIVRILNAREIPVVFSTVGPPVVALAAYGVIRYGLSEMEPMASAPMMQSLAAALLFFLVLNNVRHRWHVTLLVWVLVSTGTVIALGALWQVIAGSSSVWAFPQ